MKHILKSDSISIGTGIDYSLGGRYREKEALQGDAVSIKPGKKEGLPHVRGIDFQGLAINIELDEGMMACGKDPDGIPWETVYRHPYGEIVQTEGRDHDPVDVYIGPNAESQMVFVVHQLKKDGSYDEDKVFLGFDTGTDATRCYFEHGPQWGFGSIDVMDFYEFMHGYLAANREGGVKQPLVVTPDMERGD